MRWGLRHARSLTFPTRRQYPILSREHVAFLAVIKANQEPKSADVRAGSASASATSAVSVIVHATRCRTRARNNTLQFQQGSVSPQTQAAKAPIRHGNASCGNGEASSPSVVPSDVGLSTTEDARRGCNPSAEQKACWAVITARHKSPARIWIGCPSSPPACWSLQS